MPRTPTFVAASTEHNGIDLSSQNNALARFIILFRRPLPPFPFNKHTECGRKCLGITVLSVYVYVVYILPQLSIYEFLWVLYQSDCQELFLHVFL